MFKSVMWTPMLEFSLRLRLSVCFWLRESPAGKLLKTSSSSCDSLLVELEMLFWMISFCIIINIYYIIIKWALLMPRGRIPLEIGTRSVSRGTSATQGSLSGTDIWKPEAISVCKDPRYPEVVSRNTMSSCLHSQGLSYTSIILYI